MIILLYLVLLVKSRSFFHLHSNDLTEITPSPTLNLKHLYHSIFSSFFLDSSQTLFVQGGNEHGTLGLGEEFRHVEYLDDVTVNPFVEGLKVKKVCGGEDFAILLTMYGEIYSFGAEVNEYGQLARETTTDDFDVPVKIENYNSEYQKWFYGKDIACGMDHVLVLTVEEEVYGWGRNLEGQVDHMNLSVAFFERPKFVDSEIKEMSTGYFHSCLKKNSGGVYCFGENVYGELGNENSSVHYVDVMSGFPDVFRVFASGWNTFMVMNSNDDLYGTGMNSNGQLGIPSRLGENVFEFIYINENLNNIIEIKSANNGTNMIRYDNNDVYWSGNNIFTGGSVNSEFSRIDYKISSFSLSSKDFHFLEEIKCHNIVENSDGVCSNNGICILDNSCLCFSEYFNTESCTSKRFEGVNYVYSTGENLYGSNGFGNFYEKRDHSTFQRVDTFNSSLFMKNASYISSNMYSSLILTKDHTLYKVGRGDNGEIGNSLNINQAKYSELQFFSDSEIEVRKICNSLFASYAFSETGNEIYVWGEGKYGELGNGIIENSNVPIKIPLDVFTENKIVDLSCGSRHVLVLLEDEDGNNEVYGFGNNYFGQLGNSIDHTNYFYPMEMNNGIFEYVDSLVLGYDHSCVLTTFKELYCWGSNLHGQICQSETIEDSMVPLLIDTDVSNLFVSGNNTMFVDANNDLVACGINEKGQLGISSDCDDRYFPERVPIASEIVPKIVHFESTISHSAILLNNGSVLFSGVLFNYDNEEDEITTQFHFLEALKDIQVTSFSLLAYATSLVSGFICYDKMDHSENVCFGHGVCEGNNFCRCEEGYGNFECQEFTCDNILSSDMNACNGNDNDCVAPNICNCSSNFRGAYCEIEIVHITPKNYLALELAVMFLSLSIFLFCGIGLACIGFLTIEILNRYRSKEAKRFGRFKGDFNSSAHRGDDGEIEFVEIKNESSSSSWGENEGEELKDLSI